MTARLIVLISGNGSNLQAILDACSSGELDAKVVSVISNKADAYGLVRAQNAGVEATHFPKLKNESRNEYDARLAVVVLAKQPDYVILAGWMRVLSSSFLSSFPNRVINLHPALPEMFPGTHAAQMCRSEDEIPKCLLPINNSAGTVRPIKAPATYHGQG